MLQGSSVPFVRERDQAEARAERCSGQVDKWVPYRQMPFDKKKGKTQQSYVHSPLRICHFCSESYDPTTLQMSSRTKNGNKERNIQSTTQRTDTTTTVFTKTAGRRRVETESQDSQAETEEKRMRPEWTLKIKEEVEKQLKAGFLVVTEYPKWLANIVPVLKKDGRVRMCVDFRDLNKAGPKDDFPLPHIDILVDNKAGHSLLSFMDDFSGYNQIKMAPEEKICGNLYIPQWGRFCYRVMPFGLKKAGVTYQRAACLQPCCMT